MIQRVSRAEVTVDGLSVGACGAGLVVLLGVAAGDSPEVADRLARKVSRMSIDLVNDGPVTIVVD